MSDRVDAVKRAVLDLSPVEVAQLNEWLADDEAGRAAPQSVSEAATVAGIDGCRAGWYVVVETAGGVTGHVAPDVAAALALAPGVVAIDIPIGLPDAGDRLCDRAARRALAPRRASSVFPSPIRPALGADTHAEASEARRAVDGKGMSIQAFAIMPKIDEVDRCLRGQPDDAARVFEVHPEVTFARMAGAPLAHSKKTEAGRDERLALLHASFGDHPARLLHERPRKDVAADDVLDAFAALWTARRIAAGRAESLPADPPRDRFGLPMAIRV